MKRHFAIAAFLVLACLFADSLVQNRHTCSKCGVSMVQHEQGSPIYKCLKCGSMVDTEYVAPSQR